jgi:exodeoxyribonuclease-3
MRNILLRIISVNLNGIRSASNKGFYAWLAKQGADVICMQELKAQATDMTREMLQPDGLYGYFHYAEKKGYSGVGIYSNIQPDAIIDGLSIPDIDA